MSLAVWAVCDFPSTQTVCGRAGADPVSSCSFRRTTGATSCSAEPSGVHYSWIPRELDPNPAVEILRIHPLSQAARLRQISLTFPASTFNTIYAMDLLFFDEINEEVQEELNGVMDPVFIQVWLCFHARAALAH